MARRKRASQPLVVEQCWPTKKARVNGGRKKRSVPEPEQTEENLAAVNIQTEETALEVETEPERVEVRLKKAMLRYTPKKLKLLSTLRLKTLITRVLARC